MKNEEFINALYHNDEASLRAILAEDASLLSQLVPNNTLGWGVLHTATNLNYSSIIQLFIELGIDVNQLDRYGWNAAHIAVMKGYKETFKILIAAGISIHSFTNLRENLVFMAAKFNRPQILSYLLEKQASLMMMTVYQMTPFHTAAANGNLLCLKILLRHKNCPITDNKQLQLALLNLALSNNHLHIANYLVAEFNLVSDIAELGVTLAHPDIRLYSELSRCVVSDAVDINKATELLPLCVASENAPLLIACLWWLVPKQEVPQLSPYINTILQQLTHMLNHQQLVSLLLENHPKIAMELLAQFPTINRDNMDGQDIPFIWLACEHDDPEMLKAIFSCFAMSNSLTTVDQGGNTLLHVAAQTGAVAVMEYLIGSYPFSLNTTNKLGQAPLHLAVSYNQEAMAEFLLGQSSVDPNLQDANLHSPLHLAAMHNYSVCAEWLLLSPRVNHSVMNKMHKTPLIIADEFEHDSIAKLLKNAEEPTKQQNKCLYPKVTIAVLQGGGVKGAAFYGSLQRLLERDVVKLSDVKILGGVSAGAISAMLLALGYSVQELGSIVKNLNFYDLLEPTLKNEFFAIKAQLSTHNGLESFLGESLFGIINKLKRGELSRDYIATLIASFATDKVSPVGIIHNIAQKLGIHDNEFNKLREEFEQLLEKLDPFISHFKNHHRGLFAGEVLRNKFIEWIKAKNFDANLTFQMLHEHVLVDSRYKDLYVAAYNINERRTEIFSYETTPNAIIADAIRCSMSIQLFFEPHKHYINKNGLRCEDERKYSYFDGGSLNNYILSFFDKIRYLDLDNLATSLPQADHKVTNPHAIGLRLLEPKLHAYYEDNAPLPHFSGDGFMDFILNIVHSFSTFTKQEDDYIRHHDEQRRTIHINTYDIDTVDFDIGDEQKEKLITSGREAVDRFIQRGQNTLSTQVPDFIQAGTRQFLSSSLTEKFDYLYNMAKSNGMQEIQTTLTSLNMPINCIRDQEGNTLLHTAVREGDVTLLAKLCQLEPKPSFKIENNQGAKPLDCVIDCREQSKRESILDFFLEKDVWFSNVLNDAGRNFRNALEKREHLLQIAHVKELTTIRPHNLIEPNQAEATISLLSSLAESQNNINWAKSSKRELLNYVYLLIKQDKRQLLKKLRLSIDQADEQGRTALHRFVIENNRECVEACFSCLAFPHGSNKACETPLDMVAKINSFSSDDTKLQQQMMVSLLLKNGCYRCNATSKVFIEQLMYDFNMIDLRLKNAWEKFQDYDQNACLDAEYKEFRYSRDIIQINQNSDISTLQSVPKNLPESASLSLFAQNNQMVAKNDQNIKSSCSIIEPETGFTP